jgi:hypothetical protein
MKVRKYKNGTVKMTAENKQDSKSLLGFVAALAGEESNFAQLQKEKEINNKK